MTINYRHTEPGTGAAYFAYRGLVNSGAETGNLSVTAFVAGWNAAMAAAKENERVFWENAAKNEDKNPVDVDAHTIDCTDECECMGGKDSDCTVCDGHRFTYDPDRSGHILAWDQCIYCDKDREDHG